jgi:hypothetical protein
MLKDDDYAAWRRVREETRLAIEDVHARGIGARRLQLLFLPSFEWKESVAFEIRCAGDEWRLFRSRVVEPFFAVRLLGYDQIRFESAKLAEFFQLACSLSIPITPCLDGSAGCDGVSYELSLFGDLWSECRFRWWSEPPSQWQPLIDLYDEMLRAFLSATRSEG